MSDLIVDFPHCDSKKAVQFANMTQIKFVERIDIRDTSAVWYADKDYKTMRVATKKAALYAHKRLSSVSSCSKSGTVIGVDELEDICLNGIENILTAKSIKKTKARRSQCIGAVLLEQERQTTVGVHDLGRLACVSQHRSESASIRAQNIGFLQSQSKSLPSVRAG